ncbi:uncharacterized protein UDID_04566 [Ustilago sp. UG-2017a]|nr:uncharacterized protein UDID_04566 [Ustilago sp. UG-2017a]
MQQPTATMAAPLPFGCRPSGSFPSDFPGGADLRHNAAQSYTADHQHHQHNPFPHQSADHSANYHHTSGRALFDQQFGYDAASGSNVPSWFYSTPANPPTHSVSEAGTPYQLDSFAQHASAAVPSNPSGSSIPALPSSTHVHGPMSATSNINFPSKSTPFSPSTVAPFIVGTSGRTHPPSAPTASHSIAAAAPASLSDRRSSDENTSGSATNFPLSAVGSAVGALSLQGHVHSAPESAGFNGSISPNSSARMSGSPEANNASQIYPDYTTAAALPPGGMVMGAPASASMLESIGPWLAPAPTAPANVISLNAGLQASASMSGASKPTPGIACNMKSVDLPAASGPTSSSRVSAGNTFHSGSSSNDSSSVPFKTSIERRERNKASQRESRKRKQDRLETLETENVALRKALADMKKFSHAPSNGAGIRGEDGAEVAPLQLTKFTGAFHLDLIESHLDDETAEAEWNGMIGHRFSAQTSQAQDCDGSISGIASSTSDSDEENGCEDDHSQPRDGTTLRSASVKDEADTSSPDKRKASSESSQTSSQQAKKAMWEISLNQKRQKAAQSFSSMVAVPELVLYKVCRLYFSTLLPFTTKLKSGIINLRAAREKPGFIGGFDDFPRFPGDSSSGATELYLPKNLMPTEMQMRIGFHPVEIAVLPYPAMRDRVLTILSAFQAIEELAQEEEDAARVSEQHASSDNAEQQEQQQGQQQQQQQQQQSQQHQPSSNDQGTELTDADIHQRTAMVADMSAWKPKDFSGAVVMPDKGRVYSYGFLEKPRGSHRLRKPAQRWLDDFFYEVVKTLRVWSPAGDVFDGECFEFKESFFRKYPYMVDGEILRATNRWRRARGEDPIRL